MVIFLPKIRHAAIETMDNTEKIRTCISMLRLGISQTIMPVTNAETDIHKKKKAGINSSISKQTMANTHQYQKTKANAVILY
jgi:hypothetical protein